MKESPIDKLRRLGYSVTEQIDTGGSPRLFFRCRKGMLSCIAIYDRQRAREYMKLQRHLLKADVAVPQIYGAHGDLLITEDLGQRSLLDLVKEKPAHLDRYYRMAIRELIRFQVGGRPGAPIRRRYDARHIEWEQDYFRKFFLHQYLQVPRSVIAGLNHVFQNLKRDAARAIMPVNNFLMHRDYQSSNVMVKNDRIRIIDFQSARIGPLTYDLAALLRDPYVSIPEETQRSLVAYYLAAIRMPPTRLKIDGRSFEQAYRLCALQRLLQALGAYANLSLNRGKPRFKKHIARGVKLLKRSLRGSDYEDILGVVEDYE